MINFNLSLAHSVISILQLQAKHADDNASIAERTGGLTPILRHVTDDEAEAFRAVVKICADVFQGFDAPHLQDLYKEVLEPLRQLKTKTWREHHTQIQTLVSAITNEFKRQSFFHYPPHKARKLASMVDDWKPVVVAFPSAASDIRGATDCYALGYNEASVFHSMMILELGLVAFATKLKVTFKPSKTTWMPIIKDIKTKIEQERAAISTTPKGKKPPSRRTAKSRNQFLEHCEEAAQEFKFFTTVWRNHIAHGRGDYDEIDANKVLEHVRMFMEVAATKIGLKEVRIT